MISIRNQYVQDERVATTGFLPLFPAAQEYPAINRHINKDDKSSENQLCIGIQSCRVKHWQQVVFDKAALITGLAGRLPELLFPGCQRANPAPEFKQYRPKHGRQM